jgi:hypothetical protein
MCTRPRACAVGSSLPSLPQSVSGAWRALQADEALSSGGHGAIFIMSR